MSKKRAISSKLKLNAMGHALNDSYMFVIPLLLPFFREEFNVNYVQLGLILTIHVATRSIFTLIFGYLGDKYDKRVILAFGFICSSIFLGSLIWVNNIPTIIAFLMLLAVGVSTFHPLANTIVRENSQAHQRGKYISLFSAAGTAGLVVTSILFGIFVQIWGWKITCLLLSLPGYLLAYAYLKSIKDIKNHKAEAERKIKKRHIYLFYISLGFRSLGFWAVLSFLPIYATDYIGLKTELSSWIISILFSGVLLGSAISSKIIDKNNPLILVILATIFTTSLLLGITYIAMPLLIILFIGCLGILEGIFFPSQNTWLTFVSPVHKQGKMFGITMFVEGLSATIAPTLYGWIADQSSLIFAYRLAAIPLFTSFVLYVVLYILESRVNSTLAIKGR
ncbi:MAG: MFS transporter [Candidatus Atribacteria bacterium]|nr:MFS transporter [Candidatus Atribacteria bacterium]